MPAEKYTHHNKHFTLIIVAALIVGVIIWLPARGHRSDVREQIAQYESDLGIEGQTRQPLDRLLQEVRDLNQHVRNQAGYVPATEESTEVYRSVSQAFVGTAVNQRNIVTRPSVQHAQFGVIPVRVTFSTSFQEAFDIVHRLETAPRLFRINRVQFTGDADQPSNLHVSVELDAFFSSAEQQAEVTP